MMVAVRITLDRKRPCLACGAAWRVRSVAVRTNGPALWDDRGGQCSERCWEHNPSRYLEGVLDRRSRGWDPDDTSRCAQVA
jgi:hypothetical protein